MLYIRVSSSRSFFVNEYWILIPLMIVIDIFIIVKVKKIVLKKTSTRTIEEKMQAMENISYCNGQHYRRLTNKGRGKNIGRVS